MKISYRVSLVLVIPLLVLATGGTIAWRTFSSTRDTVDALADDLFSNVSAQAVEQTRAQVLRAVPSVELASQLLSTSRAQMDFAAMSRQYLAILRANPEFSWVSFSDAAGEFTGAYHTAAGGLRINHSYIQGGRTHLTEYNVPDAGQWTVHREVADSGYDPRTRPFYTLAAKAMKRVWTPPYVFFEQGVPGITCAQPHVEDGKLAGVFTVDFDLNSLSKFVSRLKLSAHSSVFIFTEDGTVLAHPTLKLVEKKGKGAEGKLLTLKDVDDPVLKAFVAARTPKGGHVDFSYDGAAWRGSVTPFEIEPGVRWWVGAMAPEADFMAGVARNNMISLLISLGALFVALLLAWVLSARIAGPLAELAGQMGEVGQFKLVDNKPRRTLFAEIAMMDAALRSMKGGLRSFASFVPRDVVRAMLGTGREAVLGGEVKELTVFFSDIAGFTTIAEKMKPDDLVQLLAGYFDETTQIIGERQGTVDKFIGDGIMAFWGAPAENPAHAGLACEASILYQRRIAELKAKGEPWAQHLTARIGVATGQALVGNIGSRERLNYTVMGDTVNLAARLEGLCKAYDVGILVSEATYRAARAHVVGRPIDVAAVKGKAQGIRVYELLALVSENNARAVALAELSEAALDAYLQRDFAGAAARYGQILEAKPGDKAARVLLARVEAYQRRPPGPEWNGVHVVTEK